MGLGWYCGQNQEFPLSRPFLNKFWGLDQCGASFISGWVQTSNLWTKTQGSLPKIYGIRLGLCEKVIKVRFLMFSLSSGISEQIQGIWTTVAWRNIVLGLANWFMKKIPDICPIWHGIRLILWSKPGIYSIFASFAAISEQVLGSRPVWRQFHIWLGPNK